MSLEDQAIALSIPINPLVDCVFKAMLGSEAHKGLLIHFLNSILRLPEPVTEVTLLSQSHAPRSLLEKPTSVDILAKDAGARTFQIDVQLVLHAALAERMLYYWAHVFDRQLDKGEDYTALRPVISIWVMNRALINDNAAHHHFRIWDTVHQIGLSSHLAIHTLELGKWRAPGTGVALGDEDRWLYFLRDAHRWQSLPPELAEDPRMREAMSVLKQFSEDERARHEYFLRAQAQSLEATWARTLEEAQARVDDLNARAEQEAARAEQEAARAEQEAARAEQEAARAEQEAARAEQEAARAEQEAARAEVAEQKQAETQQHMENQQAEQAQKLRQTLCMTYEQRFGALPDALSRALAAASPSQLLAWFPSVATASASQIEALLLEAEPASASD